MSQVSQAYQSLAGSLRGGMRDVGQAHLAGAKMDLLEAQQEAELGDPSRILAMEKAAAELQKKNIPYNLNTIAGNDMSAIENLTARAFKDSDKTVLELFPNALGFTEMRVDENGTARFYNPDTNQFCSHWDIEQNLDLFTTITVANLNLEKRARAVIEDPTIPDDDPRKLAAIEFRDNPAKQVEALAQQAQWLSGRQWGKTAAEGIWKRIGVIQKNMELGAKGKEKDEWSDIYKGPEGTWLRKNLTTGKVERVLGRPSMGAKEGPTKEKTEKRVLLERLAAAEALILEEPEDETVRPYVNFFNEMAERPYIYIWGPIAKKWWPDTEGTQRINLPKYKGRQVYAKDVYEKAEGNPEIVMQILKQIGAVK